jgi:hypothetical protein
MNFRRLLKLSPAALAVLILAGCAARVQQDREQRPFFQAELETDRHGKKTWLDQIIEVDPGKLKVETASDYFERPPSTVAVLPFCDEGDANFTVDKVPVTFRNEEQKKEWAWTDSQRLRRSIVGYMAQREFTIINPIAVDAVLRERGIDNMKKLRAADPIMLGRLLGADALVYGQVDSYEGYYFLLMSSYRVGVTMWMVSTRNGEELMRATGTRYSVDLQPALSPQDVAINSVMTLLEFRDVTLARAEEEVSRELVLRIPVSEKLRSELATRALDRAAEAESDEAQAVPQPSAKPAIPVIDPASADASAPQLRKVHLASRFDVAN